MSSIGPIGPITPAAPAHLVLEKIGIQRAARPDPFAGVAPFWRDLHGSIEAVGSDDARFKLLARLASDTASLPSLPDIDLPPSVLKLREEEIRQWAEGQPPSVRGRLYHLAQGANIEAAWPWHLLQSGGRFSARWKRAMCRAARLYVEALAADADALALLRQPLEQLSLERKHSLIERMTTHACAAWGIALPRLRVHEHERDGKVQQAAEATFKTEGRIEFFPSAFTKGVIELIAIVFHEATHLLQMYRLDEDGLRRSLLTPQAHEAIDDFHAEILRLSFGYGKALGARQYGNYYYLYRFETEVEREAHLAGMEAALLAAERPEFNPAGAGTMAAVTRQAAPARERIDDYDPNLVAQAYVEEKTGLRIAELPALAAGAADECRLRVPTLHALRMRRAELRAAALAPGAGVSLAMLAAIRRQRGPQRIEAPAAQPAAPWIWSALHKLEQLRDRLDRSGMLAQAILCCAPKALYGASEESRFLNALFDCALDPDAPPVTEFVQRHLENLGCRPASQQDAEGLVPALRAARARYRTPLARRILLEAACRFPGAERWRDALAHALGTSR